MYHSKDGDLYLGSDAGRIYKFKNMKLENLTYEDEVLMAVRFFFEDIDRNILVGSDRGIFKIEGLKVKRFLIKEKNLIDLYLQFMKIQKKSLVWYIK